MKGPTNSSARPNIRLLNVSATFESNPDTSTNTEFPYRASIQADGVSEYMSATVMFSQIQATSGNFATYCQTDEDVVYIYSKTDAGTITIPAVSCDLSVNYINVDNVPTEDSQAVITSGGVYDALGDYVTKGTAQTITSKKIYKVPPAYVALEVANDTTYTSGNQWGGCVDFMCDNGTKRVGRIVARKESTSAGRLVLQISDSGTGNIVNDVALINNGSAQYLTAPSRAYSSSNTTDVLTVGMMKQSAHQSVTSSAAGLTITQQYIKKSGTLVVMNLELYNTAQIAGYTTLFTLPTAIRPDGNIFASATCLATGKPSMPIQLQTNGAVLSPWTFDGGNYYFELNITYFTS